MLTSLLVVSATACDAAIAVRPVTYRLPAYVAGPLDRGTVRDGRPRFAELFCEALDHLVALGEPWAACGAYLFDAAPVYPPSGPVLNGARVLLIGGLFADCLAQTGTRLFDDGVRHLTDPRAGHAFTFESVDVSALGSSRSNAETIAAYLAAHPGPPVIAVGYSKGAADLMNLIADHADARPQIRALVTVAGTVGGSRVVDQMPGGLMPAIAGFARALSLPSCSGGDGGALASLSRPNRQALLARYPREAPPAFSVVAVADADHVSRVLRPGWDFLRAFSADEDSQVLAEDAIVPGGTYLGAVRADHWAVALHFTAPATGAIDRNVFPRAALLEALVRFVLEAAPPATARGARSGSPSRRADRDRASR